ncbi:aspartate:alanine exchanger family transporter [Rubellicoccus peritrichatus]|uniref:Aspartate:alanine exchanger family transporter n=1 Tax=Rubellicoccus peritrichatus TaxID=3080537 RepID=A0AAQ3QVV6_9BACT|nr:aspartate:alanine exchanger family transporter [Puniceicoccus sp. CR14]WOO41295.1 aspartate:alanine exchanger family transporter [Puniceicoccus sp. CR14]
MEALLENPYVVLFVVIGSGLLLGSVSIKGITLGSSGVLFTALLAGHFHYDIPEAVGTLGLVLFVYCVGIGAGGRFFSAIAREGSNLAKLGLLVVVIGSGLAYGLALLFDIPADVAVGIFAGSMTSTPALAAASESLANAGESALVIGYGIAYPFGVAGVVILIQILPRVLRWDFEKEAEKHKDPKDELQRVLNVLVEVTNPNIVNKRISESGFASFEACQVSRVMREGKLRPLNYDDTFSMGQKLLLVGRSKEIEIAIDYVGQKSDEHFVLDVENERQELLVTDKKVSGTKIGTLDPLKEHGVIISRINRLGLTFVPNADTEIESNDLLTVVGTPDNLKAFASHIGHRSNAIGETDLLSLSLGLAVGIALGMIPFGMKGAQITLGLAGGPLIAGLLLGHFGRVGRLVGHIPRPTRVLLQEFGLVLFLSDAGIRGGGAFVETIQQHGMILFAVGILLTLLPIMIALPLAIKVFGMNKLQALGGICGGMTSTPALGAITAKTDSQIPVVSYATAYPIALILMTVFAKILVGLLGG